MFNSFDRIFMLCYATSTIILLIILCVKTNKLKNTLTYYRNYLYQIMRRTESIDWHVDNVDQMDKTINETMGTLTSSIRSVLGKLYEERKQKREKILPDPQLAKVIDDSITEHIMTEKFIISEQGVKELPVVQIAKKVCKTFPYVDVEYITIRTAYICKEFINSKTGNKSK